MKNYLHNSLRALFLSLAVLLAMPVLAEQVRIDGINYELVAKAKQATVIKGYSSGEVVIPESVEHEGTTYSVTSIGEKAFYDCDDLTSVTIGNSVTSIGRDAFLYCYGIKSVHITDIAAWCNIEFGANPLYYAHHLYLNGEEVKDLVIPNSVTSIGNDAFGGCSGLTSVTIPNSVTSIGAYAFSGCSGLTSVTIPNSVESIGGLAFSGCSGLTSVTIGNSVKSIGRNAFEGCSGLKSVHILDIAAWCNIEFDFYNTYNSNPLYYAHHLYLNGEEVKDLVIPNSVTSIGDFAFASCSGLTSVTIPNSVTSIGQYAFSGCSGLTSVTIPNSVTSIEYDTFKGCSGLTSVTIGSGVEEIGFEAFANCPELLDVYCYAKKVPSTKNDAFSGSYPEYANLHVPVASIESYKTTEPWSKFGKIESIETTIPVSSITLSQTTATLTEGETLTLTATVTPDDATDKSITWSSSNTNVASVDADGKVTAKAEGTATITATANDGCGVKASCEVTVEKKVILVNQITLSQTTATLTEGETLTLTATVTPDYADNTSVTWSSSNEEVASVDANGNVTAKAEGTATITATANDASGVSASCVVTVNEIILGKCATPIISYADGQVSVTCETEDAKVVTTVANVDDGTYEEIEFSLTPTYTITAYATKAQYENSDVATLTLCWIACTEEHEDEEETGLINIPAKAVLIQSHQGIITLSGLDAGTEVAAYNTSGAQLATAVATDGTATLYTNLSTGSIVIVKFGNKSVKIKI